MARIAPIELEEASPKTGAALDVVQKRLGMVPAMMRTMARSSAVLDGYLNLNAALSRTTLPTSLREQIALTVSEINGCEYCLAAHTALGRMAGLSVDEITDSRRGVSTDRRTETVLRFARSIVEQRGRVDDAEVSRVRAAGLSEGEVAEIVALVALSIFTNYFNLVAGTELDFPAADALEAAGAAR